MQHRCKLTLYRKSRQRVVQSHRVCSSRLRRHRHAFSRGFKHRQRVPPQPHNRLGTHLCSRKSQSRTGRTILSGVDWLAWHAFFAHLRLSSAQKEVPRERYRPPEGLAASYSDSHMLEEARCPLCQQRHILGLTQKLERRTSHKAAPEHFTYTKVCFKVATSNTDEELPADIGTSKCS